MNNRITLVMTMTLLAIPGGNAQPPTVAFTFKPVVSTGSNIGGHTFAPGTVIDGATINDAGEVAFVVHWQEVGRERTGVFTSKRLVATDGIALDSKIITRIMATSLAVNTGGRVAYEATLSDGQTAVVLERKLVTLLATSGSPNDFLLGDDGHVTLKAATAAAPTATTAKNRPWLPPGFAIRTPWPLQRTINNNPNSPIYIDPNIPLQRGGAAYPKATKPPTVARTSNAPVKPCAVPPFPYPSSWVAGDQMEGPIASHGVDSPVKPQPYESSILGKVAKAFRSIQYAADCKPLIITIADAAKPENIEVFTPIGLLTHTKPDGFLDLGSFTGRVLPYVARRSDTPVRVNNHGQVLLPVTVEPDGLAILLATPTPR
jgi:hypothetical protein